MRPDHVSQYLARADRGQLVHVADQQQVRARRDGLDQLVRQDYVDHRRLVDHDQVRVERVRRIELRVAAGLQLQQPVDGRGLVTGQLGEALGGAAGRRGQDNLRPAGLRQLDH